MQNSAASQPSRGPRLSTSSHSSTAPLGSSLLNGLLPSRRASQSFLGNASANSTTGANASRPAQSASIRLQRIKTIQHLAVVVCLTLVCACLLLLSIELARTLIYPRRHAHLSSSVDGHVNGSALANHNRSARTGARGIGFFFASVWLFNLGLVVVAFVVHWICYQQRCRRDRARAAFLREFGQVFDGGKSSATNTLVDYLLKSCLLSFLWYCSCYLMLRSMTILVPVEIAILYSITVTLRQVLGWIFLHEEFIGNKIIAHILALSGLLSLAHNDGFRFNRFLLGLTMVVFAVVAKTSFDVLINGFVKDLKSHKYRIVMINVSLCGTCLFWPLVLLLHITQLEQIQYAQLVSVVPGLTLLCALLLNLLSITIPMKYTSRSSVAALLLVIPSTAVADHYLLGKRYSPLVICAILSACAGLLLSMIPKQWFQPGEAAKMKQALGLLNKDPSASAAANLLGPAATTTGTSTAFEEIRAQRRIRNALLYNEVKT